MSSTAAILKEGIAAMAIEVADPARAALCGYLAELKKWSAKMNLVARADDRTLIETHFLDSLTLLPLLREQPSGAGPLLDIGTGAGFPGLAVKCALPELAVTLAEPRQKRITFLKHVIRTLQLKGVRVEPSRVEPGDTAAGASPGPFPLITSRAFADIAAFLAASESLSPPGGLVICMKGPKHEEEIAAWREAAPQSPYRLHEVRSVRLPFSGIKRYLVVFRKSGE